MKKPVKQFNWWAVIDKNGKIWDIVNSRALARNLRYGEGDKVVRLYFTLPETNAFSFNVWKEL
jgi:hypothetical protein